MVEGLADILPEGVSRTPRTDPPSTAIVRITPQQVAHGSFVGYLLDSIECADVIEGIDGRRQTAMETEDLIVDERGEREKVEEIGKELPHIGIPIFAETLIVEAVDLRDLTRLVVAAEDGDPAWVADLERDQESNGLDGVIAAIDVIAFISRTMSRCMGRISERARSETTNP